MQRDVKQESKEECLPRLDIKKISKQVKCSACQCVGTVKPTNFTLDMSAGEGVNFFLEYQCLVCDTVFNAKGRYFDGIAVIDSRSIEREVCRYVP